ncbi:protein HEG homolog 1 [Dendropsophus ebraccatus]|uniref:protein HEG homolog 1 n=1 Tax=Dendropsophus ebraccatus TaxID=150705 RepID=UPI003831D146
MMLPGPRLLIRAVLLLGTARCSSAAPDSEWLSAGTPGLLSMTRSLPAPSRPHRDHPTWGAAGGSSPPAWSPGAAGTEGLMMGDHRLRSAKLSPKDPREIQNQLGDPPQILTDPPSEPIKTGTHGLSEPERTGTDPPSEPERTGTDPPSEPERTGTDPPSEPTKTGTDPPSEPERTGTDPPSEPERTGTDPPSEPERTGTDPPSEPTRTGTDPPSEPTRTGTDPPSEPERTGTDPLSEPTRTGTDPLSAPTRTGTNPPSEPTRTRTNPPSEPTRTRTSRSLETNRTKTDTPSEPNRFGTESLLEPNGTDQSSYPTRTGTNPPSEPDTAGTNYPSEHNKTKHYSSEPRIRTPTAPPSQPSRTDSASLSAVTVKNQTQAEAGVTEPQRGPHMYYGSEPEWMQNDAAAGITQKSATQRHLNKRTPHMDTTYISTTRGGDRTLLSVTNDSSVSDITEIPNMYPTNSGSHSSSPRNITEGWPTTVRGYRNATGDAGLRNTSTLAAASAPGTYPLQTPSYVVTTYPSPTSHHISNSTFPVTSVPVTGPSTRGSPKTTGATSNTSSIDPSSSSPSDVSGVETSSSILMLVATTSAASPSLPVDVMPQTQQPPLLVSSSSPAPSTFISSVRSSVSPSLVTSPSNPDTTETPDLLRAASSTLGPPAPSTSLPPFFNSKSTPKDETVMNKTHASSVSPTASSTSMAVSPVTPGVVTETRSHHETTTRDVTTTLKPMEAETTVMSTKGEGTLRVTVGTRLIGTPTPTMDITPSTTSTNSPLDPSLPVTTLKMPRDTMRTAGPGTPILTTADQEVMTETTTVIACNTEPPMPGTTVTTKARKTLPPPTALTTTPAVRHAVTTAMIPPTTTHPTAAVSPCSSGPCHNGGLCVESQDLKSFRCDCPASWSGHLCDKDVDECLSGPCPALSTCVNSRGSFSCQCPLGYLLEKGAGCVLVRTFLGHIEIPWSFLDGSDVKDSRLYQIKEDIVRILNSSFSTISGYYQSTVTSDSSDNLIVQNLFSMESNVTMFDLSRGLQSYAKVCETSPERPTSCQLVLHLQHRIRALSLCHVRSPGCDNETSVCADPAGVAYCQCKPGYFKYSKTDHSCRACDDGYKLENGVCVRCPFGLGGFNCSNPYQLITVIIAAGGGGLLLILVIALAVTCCRKSKRDISKLIFKSGDFQMSPYAEYPKAQRSSEWGRETIEMQENGSTKNLLQMTDVYYSPGLRNSEIERNGLYPYNGLPGSRHSCIYPGQYNPSFINEENRRRDYF